MADVRSLLRSERASRRIDHPQASYSATGTLECRVCHISLKSEVEVWNKHLKSTQHAMRAERLRLNTKQPSTLPEKAPRLHEVSQVSKKRKADDGDEDSRKKAKPVVEVPGSSFGEDVGANYSNTPIDAQRSADKLPSRQQNTPQTDIRPPKFATRRSPPTTVDEDEWAAFERDVATPPPSPRTAARSAITAAATISAAPLTATELAAQSREQATLQMKEKREAEMEGEKEDAARALEEEFDEMEGLEERVKRLRSKREELRARKAQEAEAAAEIGRQAEEEEGSRDDGEDGSENESNDEDFDGWGVWGR